MTKHEVRRIKIGAEYFSSSLIPSIPLSTATNCRNQNTRKQANSRGEVPSHGMELENEEFLMELGNKRKIASPPIHVSIPYQPQATNPLSRVGIWAPRIPKADRAKTGNGIP
ncbi:hypothetical protein HanIR_Chr14g0678991 [Helianthus annuus]|nr:hypothetical protein HanIR_Chr14g0678991 [Helianthus annuus]